MTLAKIARESILDFSPDCLNSRYSSTEANYTNTVFSQATRQFYQGYLRRYQPEANEMSYFVTLGYASVMFYVQAIQEAGTTDPEAVMAVIDNPAWRFDWFGEESQLGGLETYSIARAINTYMAYSEIHDSQVVTKANYYIQIP